MRSIKPSCPIKAAAQLAPIKKRAWTMSVVKFASVSPAIASERYPLVSIAQDYRPTRSVQF
jgi:hypothetical protein